MSFVNLYEKPGYRMGLLGRIKWWFRRRKFIRQRARQGYCDSDLWDMDSYLAEVIGAMARDLAHRHCSHPADMTEEEWESILYWISEKFRQYNVERPCPSYEAFNKARIVSVNSPDNSVSIEYPDHLYKAWREEEMANYEAKMKDLKEGFDSLYEIYPNLWD